MIDKIKSWKAVALTVMPQRNIITGSMLFTLKKIVNFAST